MQYATITQTQVFRKGRMLLVLIPIAIASSTACSLTSAPANTADINSEPTLYEELGGVDGVNTLTIDLIREIAADERIKGRYKDSDIGRFHRMMNEQMCSLTGGGCTYSGDDMQRTHAGMKVTRVEFNALVEALMRAMDKNEIPQGTQNRLLELYAPMHGDIVDR